MVIFRKLSSKSSSYYEIIPASEPIKLFFDIDGSLDDLLFYQSVESIIVNYIREKVGFSPPRINSICL